MLEKGFTKLKAVIVDYPLTDKGIVNTINGSFVITIEERRKFSWFTGFCEKLDLSNLSPLYSVKK